ncbi:hypothetical protein [Lysinibacillus sphaericus]|uniref:Uncharacterized protein n=1 Tax=Lysinibacillus sphaericus (strain C3-41) TaxID=444177 RepID=B1HPM6_LYSSC|nr:hypothetical protein [Lysinibacillus sphaericus]ACA42228.1 hypothetical protein Bsph_4784 [Lysinibacillus sphaericus C3-41]
MKRYWHDKIADNFIFVQALIKLLSEVTDFKAGNCQSVNKEDAYRI